jgi:hypothetical protein
LGFFGPILRVTCFDFSPPSMTRLNRRPVADQQGNPGGREAEVPWRLPGDSGRQVGAVEDFTAWGERQALGAAGRRGCMPWNPGQPTSRNPPSFEGSVESSSGSSCCRSESGVLRSRRREALGPCELE